MAKNMNERGDHPSATDLDAIAEEQKAAAATGGKALEDIDREIKELELEAKRLQVEELRISTSEAKARRESRKRENVQRQAQLKTDRDNLANIQSQCSHLQGGKPDDVLNGDGKPALTVARMLDGETFLIQCPRCRLKKLTPHPNLRKTDPERYEQEKAKTDALLKLAKRNGLDWMLGPTFKFTDENGSSFIPERV